MARLSRDLEQAFLTPPSSGTKESLWEQEDISLASILELAGDRTFGFLLIILSLPSALPVPIPGYALPFGIVVLLLGLQLLAGAKTPWLPRCLLRRTIPRPEIQKIVRQSLPWLQRVEVVSRPRFKAVCTSRGGRLVLGVAVSFMAISMILPLLGTHTLPAISILIIGFGLLDDDGLMSLMGLGMSVIALGVTSSIVFTVVWGGNSLLHLLTLK